MGFKVSRRRTVGWKSYCKLTLCFLQFCTPIASAWLVGGGKVTPISLFDDTSYSSQTETNEEEEDEDAKNSNGPESSVYLGTFKTYISYKV